MPGQIPGQAVVAIADYHPLSRGGVDQLLQVSGQGAGIQTQRGDPTVRRMQLPVDRRSIARQVDGEQTLLRRLADAAQFRPPGQGWKQVNKVLLTQLVGLAATDQHRP